MDLVAKTRVSNVKATFEGVNQGPGVEVPVDCTVCPKVPYISWTPLFSALSEWIKKPFELLIALTGRFGLVYKVA